MKPLPFCTQKLTATCLAFVVALSAQSALAAQKSAKKSPKKRAVTEQVEPVYHFEEQPEVIAFVEQMQAKHGFESAELLKAFSLTKRSADAIRLMTPAATSFKKSWPVYRSKYLDNFRISQGIKFWSNNQRAIAQASEKYGVPEEIMVSIIGVETVYGRVTGNFRVMDALSSLAFAYPRRAAFFKEELEQFLLLARDQDWNLFEVKGSFAGAIGLPQFMPGSIRRHAVDFSQDGKIDLRASPEDAVGSIASFLVNHGWQPGKPTHALAQLVDPALAANWLSAGLKPSVMASQTKEQGVASTWAGPNKDAQELLALIELQVPDEPSQYVVAAQNFYVITRYNQSSFYALAVIELAQALRAAYPGKTPVDK
jgi:membrane-bound lytic murein transglycosylase B